MFRACDSEGNAVLAWDAQHAHAYFCPVCLDPVLLRHGQVVRAHFAHKPGATCPEGAESERHLQMKLAVAAMFPGSHYEVRVPGVTRRADVLASGLVVIECQDSPIATEQIVARTSDWNRAGYPVTWVFDIERTGYRWCVADVMDRGMITKEVRVAKDALWWHNTLGQQLYCLDALNQLLLCHLYLPEGRISEDWGAYVPETIRHPCFVDAGSVFLPMRIGDLVVAHADHWNRWRYPDLILERDPLPSEQKRLRRFARSWKVGEYRAAGARIAIDISGIRRQNVLALVANEAAPWPELVLASPPLAYELAA